MSDFQPHEAAIHDVQAMPVTLPGRPVGRDDVLKQVYAHLKANKTVLIHGPAGIGKTAIAVTLASAYAQQPGGTLWLSVDNSPLPELLVRVGRAYQVAEITSNENPLAMVGAVANTLQQHKPLVVLDGRLDPTVAAQFIEKCVGELPALITSDEVIEGPWEPLELSALDEAAAITLFKQQAGISDDSADAEVGEIVKLLGFVPLGINIAARAMLASKKPAGEFQAILDQVATATDGDGTAIALTTSFRALNKAIQGLLLILGATFNGQASGELLGMISGAPPDSVQQVMNMLAQLHLVERSQRYDAPYYRLHPLVHSFTQKWLKTSSNLDSLQEKVRDSVVAYAEQYGNDDDESHHALAGAMDSVIAAARWAGDEGDRNVANQIMVALTQAGDFINTRGYLYELLLLRAVSSGFTTAFPAYADESDQDVLEEGDEEEMDFDFDDEDDDDGEEDVFDRVFGAEHEQFADVLDEDDMVLLDEDEEEEAIAASVKSRDEDRLSTLRMDLAEARQAQDVQRQIETLKAIGKIQVSQKMENEAIATYTELLNANEAAGDQSGILEMLDMLSALMTKTENLQAAVLHVTRGIELAEELDELETGMHLQTTLGDARQQLGESEDAIHAYGQALASARNRGDSQNEAIILYKLGYAQLDNNDVDSAVHTWEQALTLFKEQEKRDYEGRVLGGLGSAYGEMQRWAESINFHTSALHIAREVGDKEEEALQLSSLGQAGVQANQLPQALLRYRQALHLAYVSNDRDNIVSAIVDLVRLMLRSRRLLNICELLIDDALRLEPNDRDVTGLKARIASEKELAEQYQVVMAHISGSAQDYAANAYKLLDA